MAHLSFPWGWVVVVGLEGLLFLGPPGWLEVLFGRKAAVIICKVWWVPCGRHPIKPPRSLWLFWSFAAEASRKLIPTRRGQDPACSGYSRKRQCLNHLPLISDSFSSCRLGRVGLGRVASFA